MTWVQAQLNRSSPSGRSLRSSCKAETDPDLNEAFPPQMRRLGVGRSSGHTYPMGSWG